MAQDVKEKHKNCEECMEKRIWGKPDDIPTNAAGLGFRVWFSLLSVCVLGLTVKLPTQDSVISVLIFIIPLMREYYSFRPNSTARKALRTMELLVLWLIVAICGMKIVGILEIAGAYLTVSSRFAILSGIRFRFVLVWYFLIVSAIFTVADFVAYKPKGIKIKKNLLE